MTIVNSGCDEMLDFENERSCCEIIQIPRMPKSFLMSAKRKEETLTMADRELREDDNSSDGDVSPKPLRHHSDGSVDDVHHKSFTSHPLFRPSTESAFSKIHKDDPEDLSPKPPTDISPTATSPPYGGFYPAFYPSMFTYPFITPTSESATTSTNNNAFMGAYVYPSLHMQQRNEDSVTSSVTPSPMDKNMYYYVDPRIPFTNYFMNLTKLLKNSAPSTETSATTPLGKMAGEEKRCGDTDQSLTPESLKSSPSKGHSPDTSLSPVSSRSFSDGEQFKHSELKIDVQSDRLKMPGILDVPHPLPGGLLHHTHAQTMMPLHTGRMFHPALMQLPGSAGYRRYNPEKPPPVKKYKCDVCGKAFSRSNTLVTHKRIHTGDKPFKCEICSRAFRQPGNLTRHRLTHTTVKPYVCPTCNKAFNRASNLHTHMRTHTSFKSYMCPYCGKGFHQKIDMKIHCYTHTAHTARLEAQ